MNPKLTVLFNRRSVRKYTDEVVSDETVRDILEAGMAAPSAVAKDPWAFIVVRDRDMLGKIAEALPNGKMLTDAALGIVVCGDIDQSHGNELSYMLQDCAAAIENMLLAISALDLGACWLGVHPRKERLTHLKQLFSLPKNIIPISVIAMGHPAENPAARTRFKIDSVHYEKW